jgi:hypothetical protein
MYEMNRKSLLFVLPIIALALMSCRLTTGINRQVIQTSGKVKTEQREVGDIERVSLEGLGDMTVIQGNEEGLSIEADENVLPYIETTMRGHELVLRLKDGYQYPRNTEIHYTLKIKSLNQVSISGAGNMTSEKLNVGDLTLNISGAGNMKIADLQAQDLKATASGSGNYDLKGKVKSESITISGVGNYTAGDMESVDAEVTVSGSGNVTLWATGKLDVHVAGFGNVNYYGQPAVSQNITGGGSVKSLGEHK